ncbi:lens fiber membrane intrinsic protein-like [Mixophyes fleayi]|uniref:lens fiber membrane intrinsic protein-like n=1 Tax=Mixophyes fleayi TaxID=3061075 RepID=UPI003F4DAC3D
MLFKNIVGTFCACLSFILLLTGILTDFWYVSFGSNLFHAGLWQNCTKNICNKITEKGYIDATRALLILSTSLIIFAMLVSCLALINYHIGKITASLVTATLEVLSAMFLLIGMSVYTAETYYNVVNSSYNYQWSFYLCWTANVTVIIAAIFHLLAHKSSPLPDYETM